MTKQTSNKFSPEVRERAVRMVFDHQTDRIVVSRMISKVDLAINLDFSLKRKREPSIPRSFSDQ